MDATNNGAVSKLVKAWEAKNGERAKRVAGLGLMAVSLAACGSEDDSTDPEVPVVTPLNAALTIGRDVIVGTTEADTINAVDASNANAGAVTNNPTLTALDSIDGGAGIDTINITTIAAFTVPAGATVVNVEIANITSGGTVTADTTAWTGLTTLNSTAVGDADLTAGAAVNVASTVSAVAAGTLTVTGGNAVTVSAAGINSTAAANGTITATGAAGAVVVNATGTAGASTIGLITVTGGDTVTVNQTASNAVATTTTLGGVTVTGDAGTTAITVNNAAAAVAAPAVVGVSVGGAVTITDAADATALLADSIRTVTLSNFGVTNIDSSALTTLNVTGGATNAAGVASLTIDLDSQSAITPATALTINSAGGFMGAIDTTGNANYTAITINSSAATTIADLTTAAAVTALNFTGAGATTLTANTLSATLVDINVTGAGGVTLGGALAAGVDFDGGAGADSISIGTSTQGITMGGGDDTVTFAGLLSNVAGTIGSVDGGTGTDTISLSGANAVALSANATFEADFTNFERLAVGQLANSTLAAGANAREISLANLNDINFVTLAGAAAETNAAMTTTISGFASGGTFAQTALLGANSNVTLTGSFTGGADTFNLSATGTNGYANAGALVLAGVETVSITLDDSDATAATVMFDLNLDAVNATTVTVSGDAGITFANSSLTAVTTLDASGVTAIGAAGVVTFVGNNIASTITGGAGNDALTGGSQDDVISGGAGTDALVGGAGNDRISGGADVDTITGGTGIDTLTGGAGADIFVFGVGDATIDAAGLGRDTISDFNTGGADVIRVAAANNVAAADVVAAPVAATSGSISAGGQLTFNAADDTLAEQIVIAIAETGTDQAVFWENGGNTYVYFSGAAGDGTNDQLIELAGITGRTTLTESILTAGDFTLA